jgi:hypothetical protein
MQPRTEGSAIVLDGLSGRCGLLKCSADELDLFACVAQRKPTQPGGALAWALRARHKARSVGAEARRCGLIRNAGRLVFAYRPRMLHFAAPR